jgi:hypothetical protein
VDEWQIGNRSMSLISRKQCERRLTVRLEEIERGLANGHAKKKRYTHGG